MVTEELKQPTSLNIQALCHLASTCRAFCSPALDVLWPNQIGLRPILCTIPQVKEAYDQWFETHRDRDARAKVWPWAVPTLVRVPVSLYGRGDFSSLPMTSRHLHVPSSAPT